MSQKNPIDIQKLITGDRRTLAKAITLIESSKKEDRKAANELLKNLKEHTGQAFRIGISGSPGVGKSTFIESLGEHLIEQGHMVAVLAIDPSSPLTGGSILGDKTRMEKLSQCEQAFIRPTPSSGSLGGVAQKTKETALLCEAAGYDIILIETVGVGQSEHDVANLVDFFLLLMLPGGGDELQGIKKGIMELADLIAINKEDINPALAKSTKHEYENALRIVASNHDESSSVLTCSAQDNKGIQEIWTTIKSRLEDFSQSGKLQSKRLEQEVKWFDKLIHEGVQLKIKEDEAISKNYQKSLDQLKKQDASALEAAEKVLKKLFS